MRLLREESFRALVKALHQAGDTERAKKYLRKFKDQNIRKELQEELNS